MAAAGIASVLEEADALRPTTANRLLVAAAEAFAEVGFHGATTRAIAAKCGLSPAGVYVHYSSKEELLHEISRAGHLSALRAIREAGGVGADERLRSAVRAFAKWHATNHTLARVIQYELGSLTREHHRGIASLRRQTAKVLSDVVDHGVADGVFACPNPAAATLGVLSLCIDIARWFPSSAYSDPVALADLYADLAAGMVGSWAMA